MEHNHDDCEKLTRDIKLKRKILMRERALGPLKVRGKLKALGDLVIFSTEMKFQLHSWRKLPFKALTKL